MNPDPAGELGVDDARQEGDRMQEFDAMLESCFQNFTKQVEEKMVSIVANLMTKSAAIAMDSANCGTGAKKQTSPCDTNKNNTESDTSAWLNKAIREKKSEHGKKKCKRSEDSSDSSSESDDDDKQDDNDNVISLSCDSEDKLLKELDNDLEDNDEMVEKVSQPIPEHVNRWFTEKFKESKLKKLAENYPYPKNCDKLVVPTVQKGWFETDPNTAIHHQDHYHGRKGHSQNLLRAERWRHGVTGTGFEKLDRLCGFAWYHLTGFIYETVRVSKTLPEPER